MCLVRGQAWDLDAELETWRKGHMVGEIGVMPATTILSNFVHQCYKKKLNKLKKFLNNCNYICRGMLAVYSDHFTVLNIIQL